ncbi:MAG: hypothetical protein ABR564_07715 [Candidatus Dormibacteria bacterium]
MRPLLSHPDPIEAELIVSQLLGMVAHVSRQLGGMVGRDGERDLQEGLVAAVARLGSPAAHAALLALAAVCPPAPARRAQVAAHRLRLRGIPAPAWSAAAGSPPALIRALRAGDVYGDVDGFVLVFSRRNHGEQSIVLLVDHNLGGAVKDAFALDPEVVFESLFDSMHGDMKLVEIAPATAAATAIRGMELADAFPPGPPIDDTYWATRAVLSAWLHAVPGVDTSAPEPMSVAAREQLVDAFFASAPGRRAADVAGHCASFIVSMIVDYCADEAGDDALRMSPRVVELFLCGWFPRRVTADETTIEHVPAVLTEWVRFAGRRRGLPPDVTGEAVSAIRALSGEFRARCSDPDCFGPAKRMVLAMRGDGVDPSDPAAMERWTTSLNERGPEAIRALVG